MSKELSMAGIEKTLTKLTARWQKRYGGEMPPGAVQSNGVERRTPATELEAKEVRLGLREPEQMPLFDGEPAETSVFEEMGDQVRRMREESEEAALIFLESTAWLLDFFFADGPHPAKVMRRVYAWTKKFRPANIWDAGFRDLGNLLGESHAAMGWRIGKLIDDYAAGKGVMGHKMPWQRGQDACDGYSDAQKGNVNRLGGRRAASASCSMNWPAARRNARPAHFPRPNPNPKNPANEHYRRRENHPRDAGRIDAESAESTHDL